MLNRKLEFWRGSNAITYPPGEEPAQHGEGEERSASSEHVHIGNTEWCV